jgi:hypothetical protein
MPREGAPGGHEVRMGAAVPGFRATRTSAICSAFCNWPLFMATIAIL